MAELKYSVHHTKSHSHYIYIFKHLPQQFLQTEAGLITGGQNVLPGGHPKTG